MSKARSRTRRRKKVDAADLAKRFASLIAIFVLLCVAVPPIRRGALMALAWAGMIFGICAGLAVILGGILFVVIKRRKTFRPHQAISSSLQSGTTIPKSRSSMCPSVLSPRASPDAAHAIGRMGESMTDMMLRNSLSADEYVFLSDIYLPVDNATTQIDEIVVSTYGVFVIEVKTYGGWILANQTAQWIQSFRGGQFRFQNPIRQNYRHLCVLSECTGIPQELMVSVVAFAGDAEFKGDLAENPSAYPGVVHAADIPAYIRSFAVPRIKPEQVGEIADAIHAWQASIPPEVISAHVENLKAQHDHR